jgi:hypothetical protein
VISILPLSAFFKLSFINHTIRLIEKISPLLSGLSVADGMMFDFNSLVGIVIFSCYESFTSSG